MNYLICSKAALYAAKAHKDQERKYNGEPYIRHPMRVVKILMNAGYNSEDWYDDIILASAWLHDVVEDCGVSLDTIKNMFGKDIQHKVWELTNEYSKEKYPNLNRSARHKLEIERISDISFDAKLIKLCDRLDNLNDIRSAEIGFIYKYLRESQDLLDILRGTHELLENRLQYSINLNKKFCKIKNMFVD